MMRFNKAIAGCGILTLLISLGITPAIGQEHEPAPEGSTAEHTASEHSFHANHFGGLIGYSTHSDTDDTAFTLGLEYARQFSSRWAVGAYVESASSDIERDVILAAGVIFYPIRHMGVLVAPGVESVASEHLVHGEVETENELGFLMRLGVTYGFPVTPQAALGPVVVVDRAGDRWTTVVGVTMVTGF